LDVPAKKKKNMIALLSQIEQKERRQDFYTQRNKKRELAPSVPFMNKKRELAISGPKSLGPSLKFTHKVLQP
jgi:hypothetical protein